MFGNVATMLPSVAIPGVATLLGAGLMGAASGSIQPVASDEGIFSGLKNTLIGGMAGPIGIGLGRGIVALAKGGKALAEPLYESGRQAIAGRTLKRFGVEAGDVAAATGNPTVTGSRTTLADRCNGQRRRQAQPDCRIPCAASMKGWLAG